MGMDSVEIVLIVENHFEIQLPDVEVTEIFTLGQLHDLVCRKLLQNGQRANSEKIFAELTDVLVKGMQFPREKMVPSARFIEDLEIN
jgi:hypothetical protein